MELVVNLDMPTRIARLHVADCRYARDRRATQLKGLGELRRDGGWLEARDSAHAARLARNESLDLRRCGRCGGGR